MPSINPERRGVNFKEVFQSSLEQVREMAVQQLGREVEARMGAAITGMLQLGPWGAPPPSKTRHPAVNRLLSAAGGPHNRRVTDSPGRRCVRPCARLTCPRTSCARQLAARAFGPRHFPPRPATLWQTGCFSPRARAHHAPACMPATRARATPEQSTSAYASLQLGPWATACLGHASSFQDPPPCGEPAVFRRGPAIMRPRARPSSSAPPPVSPRDA